MCDRCATLADTYEQKLNLAGEHIAGLERDLKGKRLAIFRLEAELAKVQARHDKLPQAKEVFEFWRQEVAPKAREFNDKRRKAVLARLDAGRTVDELKQAILGCKHAGARSDDGLIRYDELELICRSDEKVMLNLKRYEAWRQRTQEQQTATELGPERLAALDQGLRQVSRWQRRTGGTTYSREDPVDRVLKALEAQGCDWKCVGTHKWRAQCPAHNGENIESLSFTDSPDRADLEHGTVILHCFVGCTTQDILGALRLDWVDLSPDRRAA